MASLSTVSIELQVQGEAQAAAALRRFAESGNKVGSSMADVGRKVSSIEGELKSLVGMNQRGTLASDKLAQAQEKLARQLAAVNSVSVKTARATLDSVRASTEKAAADAKAAKAAADLARSQRNLEGSVLKQAQAVQTAVSRVEELTRLQQKGIASANSMAQGELEIARALARTNGYLKSNGQLNTQKALTEIRAAEAAKRNAVETSRLNREQEAAVRAGRQRIDSLNQIRMRLDPVYRASQQYKASLRELIRAKREGAMTSEQYADTLGRLKSEFDRVSQGGRGARRSMNNGAMAMQQFGYQTGDFIVQVQSGTSAFIAFSQQATQLVGILPMVAGGIGLTVKSAVALSTGLGIAIPLLTAVAGGFFAVTKNAREAEEELSSFESKIKSLDQSLQDFAMSQKAAAEGLTLDEFISQQSLDDAEAQLETALSRLERVRREAEAAALTGTAAGAGIPTGSFLTRIFGGDNDLPEIKGAYDEALDVALSAEAEARERIIELRERDLQRSKEAFEEEQQAIQDSIALEEAKIRYGEDSLEVARLQVEQELRRQGFLELQVQVLADQAIQLEQIRMSQEALAQGTQVFSSVWDAITAKVKEAAEANRENIKSLNGELQKRQQALQIAQAELQFGKDSAGLARVRNEIELQNLRTKLETQAAVGGITTEEKRLIEEILRAVAESQRLEGQQRAVASAASSAAGAASSLSAALAGAAGSAARLLANLNMVPAAVAQNVQAAEGMISNLETQSRAITLQVERGLDAQVASLTVQRNQALEALEVAGAGFDQLQEVSNYYDPLIEQAETFTASIESGRAALQEMESAAGGGGGGGGGGSGAAGAVSGAASAFEEAERAANSFSDTMMDVFDTILSGLQRGDLSNIGGDLLGVAQNSFFSGIRSFIENIDAGGARNYAGPNLDGTAGNSGPGGLLGGLATSLGLSGSAGSLGSAVSGLGAAFSGGLGSAVAGIGSVVSAALPIVGAITTAANFFKTTSVQTGSSVSVGLGEDGPMVKSGTRFRDETFMGLKADLRWEYEQITGDALDAVKNAFDTTVEQLGVLGFEAVGNALVGRGISEGENFAGQMEEALTEALNQIAMSSTNGALDQFMREGEELIETVDRMATALSTVIPVLSQINQTVFSSDLSGADMGSLVAELFGGVDEFMQSADGFYRNFYSEAERVENLTRSTTDALRALGLAMPETRDQFRQLVESQDLTTKSGRETFAALLGLSDALDTILPQINETSDALAGLMGGATTAIDDMISAARDVAREAANAARDWFRASDGLRDLIRDLTTGRDSVIGLGDQEAILRRQVRETFQAALGGDIAAFEAFPDVAGDLLNVVGQRAGSLTELQMTQARIRNQANQLAGIAEFEGARNTVLEDLAETQISVLEDLRDYLRTAETIDPTVLETFSGEIGSLGQAISQISQLSFPNLAESLSGAADLVINSTLPEDLQSLLLASADGLGVAVDLAISEDDMTPLQRFEAILAASQGLTTLEMALGTDGLGPRGLEIIAGNLSDLSQGIALTITSSDLTDAERSGIFTGLNNLQANINTQLSGKSNWKALKAAVNKQNDLVSNIDVKFKNGRERRLMRLIAEANGDRIKLDGDIDFNAAEAFRNTLDDQIASPVATLNSKLQDTIDAISALANGIRAQANAAQDQARVDELNQNVEDRLGNLRNRTGNLLDRVLQDFTFADGDGNEVLPRINADGTIRLPGEGSGIDLKRSAGTFDDYYDSGGLRDTIHEVNDQIRHLLDRQDKIDHRDVMVGMTPFQQREYAISNQTGIRDALYDFERRILREGEAGRSLTDWEQDQFDRLKSIPGFSGGGFTGMGARAGGLDGEGGFLAMLHPRETVIDHNARYYDANRTAARMSGDRDTAMLNEMRALRREVAELRTDSNLRQSQIVKNTDETARQARRERYAPETT